MYFLSLTEALVLQWVCGRWPLFVEQFRTIHLIQMKLQMTLWHLPSINNSISIRFLYRSMTRLQEDTLSDYNLQLILYKTCMFFLFSTSSCQDLRDCPEFKCNRLCWRRIDTGMFCWRRSSTYNHPGPLPQSSRYEIIELLKHPANHVESGQIFPKF